MVFLKDDDNSLSNIIFQEILRNIIIGDLKPGDKLVEKEFAVKFGTSRAPVREAIYLLTKEGLVERIPRRGAVVKDYLNVELLDLLEIRNQLENMALSRIDLNDVKDKFLKEIRVILIRMKSETDIYKYAELNHKFHLMIVKMSRSQAIVDVYSRLGWPLLKTQYLSFAQKDNMKKSILEHDEIYRYIINKDKETLTDLLTNHNNYVISSIKSFIDKENRK